MSHEDNIEKDSVILDVKEVEAEENHDNVTIVQTSDEAGDEIELTADQQRERVNVFLLIIGFLLVTNASGLLVKLVIDKSIEGKRLTTYTNPVSQKPANFRMPVPYLAAYGDAGYVEAFSKFRNETRDDFPKLPSLQFSSHADDIHLSEALPYYQMFSAAYKNNVYFLSCNPDKFVTKVDMNSNGLHHTIGGSTIPNRHSITANGVQVGKYFWILGGYTFGFGGPFGISKDSSIWVLDREHWINGPELPDVYVDNLIKCSVPLNSTSVLFVSEKFFIFYNFATDEWHVKDSPMSSVVFLCTSLLDKQYERQLYFMYDWPVRKWLQWNIDGHQLQNEYILSPENFSNDEMISWNNTLSSYYSSNQGATFATLGGAVYLIDCFMQNKDLAPIYEITSNGIVRNTELVLFEYEHKEMYDELKAYYNVVKTFIYWKRHS